MSFENAHCAAPVCNPSRTATLTGVHPANSGVYGNDHRWRPQLPDAVSLPHLFRKQGYRTLGCGKVFHVNDAKAWDVYSPELCRRPDDGDRAATAKEDLVRVNKGVRFGPSQSNRDGQHSDDKVADQVIKWLRKRYDEPVFIGCGFFKPHLPWEVPQRYFDLHPLKQVRVPEVPKDDLDDVPEAGRRMAHLEIHDEIVKKGIWKRSVQAYLASTTFADAQLGRVLDALDKGPLAANTLVVVWSDHGWSLGEKFHWKKRVLWEEATRVPLVFAGPGVPAGARSRRTVSLLDLYPTLMDLCGLKPPPQPLDGRSIRPLLTQPDAPWAHPVVTTEGFRNHAVRTERWRYIRYADGSEELYDHAKDPNEWTNLAGQAGAEATLAELRGHLPAKDRAPAPDQPLKCVTG